MSRKQSMSSVRTTPGGTFPSNLALTIYAILGQHDDIHFKPCTVVGDTMVSHAQAVYHLQLQSPLGLNSALRGTQTLLPGLKPERLH